MTKDKYIKEFIDFVKKGTCAYTVTEYLKIKLIHQGFIELFEEKKWILTPGKYFITRNDASIIAFFIGKNYQNQFSIVTTHSDTPALFLKPIHERYENGYLKLNIAPYGGLLNYGWLDRPLSIAGKIIIQEKNNFTSKIIDLKKPLGVIPSVAIHLNDKANSRLDLNTQIDLIPIISLNEEQNSIKKIIQKEYHIEKNKILDMDLLLYNTEPPYIIGKEKDIIISPRLDNLTSVFAAFKAFLNTKNEKNINIFCSFNSEEIGSLTKEGADSNFLIDTLKRISASLEIDITSTLHNSYIVNSDNAHAIHPNHPDLLDNTNKIFLNKGIVISKEMVSTTDSLSSSLFKKICQKNKIPYQDYTSRNDIASGSTLASITLRHVSAQSIDIGLAQLAMHSSMECMGIKDIYYLNKALTSFYKATIQRNKKSIKLTF